MNILSINNFNIKAPLFSNKQEQNNRSFFGLKLTSPLREDTVSFGAAKPKKPQNIKTFTEKTIARTYKKAGDLKDGINNIQAIQLRLMHYNVFAKYERLFKTKSARYLSTPEKKGLATLKTRLKREFSIIQKTASLGIGGESNEDIAKQITDIPGYTYIIEDPKGYAAVIKDLSDMVKHGEINPTAAKYHKLPDEYKKGKLINSFDSLNPATSARLRKTILDVKDVDLWTICPSKSGYSGLHIIIKSPDGKFSEIQVKVRSVADLKEVEDLYYKITNGKELSPEQAPLDGVLRLLKPVNPEKLTESEKALQKALTKYSIEAYTLALEHPYEENAPFLRVIDAKTLTSKEKELVAQYDFNRIKLFQMNVDKIVDLKNIEDNYYKVMSGEHLSKGYEPLEAALSALKPIDSANLTESEKALHKAMNKYTKEAYDYALIDSFEQDRPYLAVMDTKTLTSKEKELIAPFDFNKINLFVEACEKANTI